MVLPVYVAIPQVQLLDKVVVPVVCTTNALVQVPQLQFLFKVVNIPSVRRDSFPWSHSSEAIEILLLQYTDKVDDVGCARRAGSHGCVVEETVELRRLHSLRNLLRGTAHHRVDELMG